MAEVRVRTFVKDSIILVASNAGVRLVNFLLLPVYTAALSPDAYGLSDIVCVFAILLSQAMSMQMDWGLQAFFRDGEGETHLRRLISTCLAFCLISATVALLGIILAAPLSGLLLGDQAYGTVVAFGLAYAAATIVMGPLAAATRMRGRATAFAFVNLTATVLLTLMTLAGIFVLRLGVASIAFANMVASAAAALLFCLDNRRYLSARAVDAQLMKCLLACSAPMVLTVVLAWANIFGDRYVIAWFLSPVEVGLYGIATRFMGVILAVAWGAIMAYAPFASANAGDPASRPKFQAAFDLAVISLAVLCFSVSALSKEIVTLLTAPGYHQAYVAVPFSLYGAVFYVLAGIVGYSFTIKKTGRHYLQVTLCSAAANLVLNVALVPRLGYAAAAFTTFLSYVLLFALSLRISEGLFPCDYSLARLALVTAVPGALAWLLLGVDSLALKAVAIPATVAFIGAVYASRVSLVYMNAREWLLRRWGVVSNY